MVRVFGVVLQEFHLNTPPWFLLSPCPQHTLTPFQITILSKICFGQFCLRSERWFKMVPAYSAALPINWALFPIIIQSESELVIAPPLEDSIESNFSPCKTCTLSPAEITNCESAAKATPQDRSHSRSYYSLRSFNLYRSCSLINNHQCIMGLGKKHFKCFIHKSTSLWLFIG